MSTPSAPAKPVRLQDFGTRRIRISHLFSPTLADNDQLWQGKLFCAPTSPTPLTSRVGNPSTQFSSTPSSSASSSLASSPASSFSGIAKTSGTKDNPLRNKAFKSHYWIFDGMSFEQEEKVITRRSGRQQTVSMAGITAFSLTAYSASSVPDFLHLQSQDFDRPVTNANFHIPLYHSDSAPSFPGNNQVEDSHPHELASRRISLRDSRDGGVINLGKTTWVVAARMTTWYLSNCTARFTFLLLVSLPPLDPR